MTAKREYAKQLREDAGYSGSWGDNGAAELEREVYYFECGLNGVVPKDWKKDYDSIHKEMKNETDPKYKEYLELKKKFEG